MSRSPAPRTVLSLDQVFAEDHDGPRGAPVGRLLGVRVAFPAGVFAFVGGPADGSLALTGILAGVLRPRSGRVRVHGHDPYRSSPLRRRLGSLLPAPMLPPAKTARLSVEAALTARGLEGRHAARAADETLAKLELAHLAGRRLQTLTFAEARAVELALALGTPEPLFCVLHEPLLDVATVSAEALTAAVQSLRDRGVTVVVVTSSPADARALADHIIVMQGGALVRDTSGSGVGLGFPGHGELRLTLRSGARRLAERLASIPEAVGLSFYLTDRVEDGAGVVSVRVDHGDLGARAVVAATLETDADLESWTVVAPTLYDVRRETERRFRERARPRGRE